MTINQPSSISRRSSASAASMSRPMSLTIPNPDVFSDDYAIDGSPNTSPVDSIQHSSEHLPLGRSQPRSSVPTQPLASSSRPNSTFKRPLQDASSIPYRAVSTISHAESSTQRASSTSSRFSMPPRSQSPYIGPTGPSHPYALYPQVTRASSIASESTIRPLERAFVAHAGPEHPYSMYPQNTVPEEDNPIPIGFPGLAGSYRTRIADQEVADIVGVDGHVESLPPYSRYAENAVPKIITEPVPTELPHPSMSPMSQHTDSGVELNMGASRAAGVVGEKTTWKARAQRRAWLGLPCWALLLVVALILLAGTLGGIIGGLVGQDRGVDIAASAAAASTFQAPVTTTTVFLDATPLPTTVPMPDTDVCPRGNYSVSIGGLGTLCSNSCVNSSVLADAWSCLQGGSLDIEVTEVPNGGPGAMNVSFIDSGALRPNFTYGAQPPHISGAHRLKPFGDKDDGAPTLFFWTFYNKVTIWPLSQFPLPPPNNSGSLAERQEDIWANIGEHVWVCTWENSILEFLLYPNQTTSDYSSSSLVFTPTASSPGYGDYTKTQTWSHPSPTTWAGSRRQESTPSQEEAGYPTYPQYPYNITILEKRKQSPNPPTYCELNIVQPDWTLLPITNVARVEVPELDFTSDMAPGKVGGSSKRWTEGGVKSYCACEYDNF